VIAVALLLVAFGVAGGGYGARMATLGERPVDLAGALVAALGVAVAGVGAVALLSPRFLG
jgi:hypothetical protein